MIWLPFSFYYMWYSKNSQAEGGQEDSILYMHILLCWGQKKLMALNVACCRLRGTTNSSRNTAICMMGWSQPRTRTFLITTFSLCYPTGTSLDAVSLYLNWEVSNLAIVHFQKNRSWKMSSLTKLLIPLPPQQNIWRK